MNKPLRFYEIVCGYCFEPIAISDAPSRNTFCSENCAMLEMEARALEEEPL